MINKIFDYLLIGGFLLVVGRIVIYLHSATSQIFKGKNEVNKEIYATGFFSGILFSIIVFCIYFFQQ